jgi:hypothetical protein
VRQAFRARAAPGNVWKGPTDAPGRGVDAGAVFSSGRRLAAEFVFEEADEAGAELLGAERLLHEVVGAGGQGAGCGRSPRHGIMRGSRSHRCG